MFVPGAYSSGTGVIAILIGLLGFYLAIPLGLAYYSRRWVGAKTWRVLHASIIVVYVLSVWHTLLYGTNVWYGGWFRTTVWLLQLPIAALLLVRLCAPAHRQRRGPLDAAARWLARGTVAATLVSTLVVTASGRDGGRTRDVEGAGLSVSTLAIWFGLLTFVLVVGVAVARAARTSARRHPVDRTEAATAQVQVDDAGPLPPEADVTSPRPR